MKLTWEGLAQVTEFWPNIQLKNPMPLTDKKSMFLRALFFIPIMLLMETSFAQRRTPGYKPVNPNCKCALDNLSGAEKLSLNLKAWLFSKRMVHLDSDKDQDLARARKLIGRQVVIEDYQFPRALDFGFKQAMLHGCEGIRGKLISIDRNNLVLEVKGKRRRFILKKSYSVKPGKDNYYKYIDIKNHMAILPLD